MNEEIYQVGNVIKRTYKNRSHLIRPSFIRVIKQVQDTNSLYNSHKIFTGIRINSRFKQPIRFVLPYKNSNWEDVASSEGEAMLWMI